MHLQGHCSQAAWYALCVQQGLCFQADGGTSDIYICVQQGLWVQADCGTSDNIYILYILRISEVFIYLCTYISFSRGVTPMHSPKYIVYIIT